MDVGEAGRALPGDAPRHVRRPHVEAQLFEALARLVAGGAVTHEITVAQLAREAGIGRATFYLYFADREAFNLRLVEYLNERLAQPLQRLWAGVGVAGGDVIDEAVLEFLRAYRALGPVVTAVIDAAAMSPMVAARMNERIEALIDATADAIKRGKEAGALEAEVPVYETACVLVWMTERACFQVARGADDDQLERLALALSFVSRRGLSVER